MLHHFVVLFCCAKLHLHDGKSIPLLMEQHNLNRARKRFHYTGKEIQTCSTSTTLAKCARPKDSLCASSKTNRKCAAHPYQLVSSVSFSAKACLDINDSYAKLKTPGSVTQGSPRPALIQRPCLDLIISNPSL
jgi:hypothetical protein